MNGPQRAGSYSGGMSPHMSRHTPARGNVSNYSEQDIAEARGSLHLLKKRLTSRERDR